MLLVADVMRSIRFYELLGFDLIDTEGPASCPGWARVHCEGGAIMLLLAEEPFDASVQSVLFAMYTTDLPALREHLLANGVKSPPITYPGYMPSGQVTLRDPDGYIVNINHWGDAEHSAWLKNIEQKKKSGALPSRQPLVDGSRVTMSQTVVPMIHVPNVRATIDWYTSIGFTLVRQTKRTAKSTGRSCPSETANSCSTLVGNRAPTTVAKSTCT